MSAIFLVRLALVSFQETTPSKTSSLFFFPPLFQNVTVRFLFGREVILLFTNFNLLFDLSSPLFLFLCFCLFFSFLFFLFLFSFSNFRTSEKKRKRKKELKEEKRKQSEREKKKVCLFLFTDLRICKDAYRRFLSTYPIFLPRYRHFSEVPEIIIIWRETKTVEQFFFCLRTENKPHQTSTRSSPSRNILFYHTRTQIESHSSLCLFVCFLYGGSRCRR